MAYNRMLNSRRKNNILNNNSALPLRCATRSLDLQLSD